jgi:chorismate mutase
MPITQSLASQLHTIDRQIVELLAERVSLSREAMDEDSSVFSSSTQAETIADWEEMADEKGLNPGVVGLICKAAMKLCKAQEI